MSYNQNNNQYGYGPNTTSNINPNSNNSQFGYGHQSNLPHSSNMYPTLNEPTTSGGYNSSNNYNNPNQGGGNIFEQALGGFGGNQQQGSNNNQGNGFQQQQQQQMQGNNNNGNGFQGLMKMIDWDQLLKDKNFTKQQSDTSWVTYQEESWKQPKPSDHIQTETDIKFAFPNPYIKYKIIPGVDQKKALDVTAKDDLNKGLVKGNLVIWDYHGGPNQQFYIHRVGDQHVKMPVEQDEFILINASNGFCVSNLNLQAANQKGDNKNHVCVYPKLDNYPAQRWKLKSFNKNRDIFIIQSVSSGKVLDCEGASKSNGTNVIQWDCTNAKNQAWKILPA